MPEHTWSWPVTFTFVALCWIGAIVLFAVGLPSGGGAALGFGMGFLCGRDS